MMSQTLPEYKEDAGDSTKRSYDTFSFGLMGEKTDLTYIEEDCNGNPVSSTQLDNIYSAIGAGFSRSKQLGWKENLTLGVNAYVGNHQEKVTKGFSNTQQLTYYGVNPYLQYDRRRIGIGAGIHIGNMSKIITNYDGGYNAVSSVRQYAVFPSFNFRYGNLQKVFTEVKWANKFPTPFPAHEIQWSFGFGLDRGSVLRFGTSSFSGFFIYPSIVLKEQFILEPWIGFGGGFFNSYDKASSVTGSVSLHYKFNKKSR